MVELFKSVRKVWSTHKSFEKFMSMSEYGVYSLGLAFLIDGMSKMWYVLSGGAVSFEYIALFFVTGLVRLAVRWGYGLDGAFYKLDWLKYATIGSIACHGVAFAFVVGGLPISLLYGSLGMLVFNTILLKVESRK